jgi:hypothetical protein
LIQMVIKDALILSKFNLCTQGIREELL